MGGMGGGGMGAPTAPGRPKSGDDRLCEEEAGLGDRELTSISSSSSSTSLLMAASASDLRGLGVLGVVWLLLRMESTPKLSFFGAAAADGEDASALASAIILATEMGTVRCWAVEQSSGDGSSVLGARDSRAMAEHSKQTTTKSLSFSSLFLLLVITQRGQEH